MTDEHQGCSQGVEDEAIDWSRVATSATRY